MTTTPTTSGSTSGGTAPGTATARGILLQRMTTAGVVAIMRHTAAELATEAADALLRGGVSVVEVTLNTAGAAGMIRDLVARFGDRMVVGAGTVLTTDAVEQALDAGARFVVAPNTDVSVIELCNRREVPVLPGAFTPTEVVAAWQAGADLVKVFPVSSVGSRYIRDLRGPLPHIPLVPTGGVTVDNAADFIRAGAAALGAGSDLVDRGVVDRRDFAELERRARGFSDAVARGRA